MLGLDTKRVYDELYDAIRINDDWRKLFEYLEKTPPSSFHIIVSKLKETEKGQLINILITDNKTNMVLDVIQDMEPQDLGTPNFNSDTALHLAASTGNIDVAEALIEKNPRLLSLTNSDGEIPLHKAALNGKRIMFWRLYDQSDEYGIRETRSDGTNVLHCAVLASDFELAFEIAERHPELIGGRDKLGLTPIHHMISTPNAFHSRCRFSPIQTLFYHCAIVEKSSSQQSEAAKGGSYHEADLRPKLYVEQGKLTKWIRGQVKSMRTSVAAQWIKRQVNKIRRKKSEEEEEGNNTVLDLENPVHVPTNSTTRRRVGLGGGGEGERGVQLMDLQPNWVHSHSKPYTVDVSKQFFNHPVIWMRTHITNIMELSPYTKWLIDRKKRHKNAIKLLSFVAKNQEIWLSLTCESNINIPNHEYYCHFNKGMSERWKETPLTLAATLGIDEAVITILENHPAAATHTGRQGKNLLHVAVENRRESIVNMLGWIKEVDPRLPYRLISSKDVNGNTILHLAAMVNTNQPNSPMQMLEEFKWFKKVKKIAPKDMVNQRNNDEKMARELFTDSHVKMVEDAKAQLTNTARSCCAALVSAVTLEAGFSIANSDDKKEPATPSGKSAYKLFSHMYIIGLSCTAMALIQFMALLMASYKEEDFKRSLPTQYALSLASLFAAMLAMLVAFGCNTYISLYDEVNPDWSNYLPLIAELFLFPVLCLMLLRYQGIKFPFHLWFRAFFR